MRFSENQPIYIQIADYYCTEVLRKRLAPGDKIPSVRETAVEMEVNPNTVMRSFQYLQDEGIIDNKRGIGYFFTDNAYDKVKKLKRTHFEKTLLPEFADAMKELSLTFNDVKEIYEGKK